MAFDQKAFFKAQAQRLHDSGALKAYDTPLGAKNDWHGFCKNTHKDAEKNTPGLVFHAGDEPYSALTTPQVQYYREINPKPADLKLKMASVMKGIRAYMPDKDFDQYLEHFTQNLKTRENREALRHSFEKIGDQLSTYNARVTTDELRILEQKGDGAKFKAALGSSELSAQAGKRPEMLLTIAIYQAAQASYVTHLNEAIQKSTVIPDGDKDNANAVCTGPFYQYSTSLLFATMVPLTALARMDMAPKPGQSEDELTRQSITDGWDRLFDSKVLTRIYSEKEVPPEKPGQKVEYTCPAINQLRAARANGSLEKVYDFVSSHRKELKTEVQEAYAATGAIRTPSPSEEKQKSAEAPASVKDLGAMKDVLPVPAGTVALPAKCPMSKMRAGGYVALALAASMIPGHDNINSAEKKPEARQRINRKWADDVDARKADAPKDRSPD